MKTTTIAALACALSATACASSTPPAQQPTSSTAEMNPPAATSPAPSATYAGSTSMMAPGANGAAPAPTPAPAPAPAPADTTAPSASSPGTTAVPDTTAAPDDTRVNTRDRHATATPINQGNSKQELGITASIRRAVMRDSSLSFTAKNVKIITQGTTVTLRGPVNSDAEKSTIENLARQAAGVTDVDDQLEVKGTK